MNSATGDNFISVEHADRLIAAHDGDVALLYIYRLRTGCSDPEKAAAALCRTLGEIRCAEEKLGRMGLAPAERPSPRSFASEEAEDELPQYTSADLSCRCREDAEYRSILDEARKVMGKNLSSVDMKELFAVYDYTGLPADVIMLMINYCGKLFEERSHGQRRPTVRAIRKEADIWARQEIMSLDMAEEYIKRQEDRRGRLAQVRDVLGIMGRELAPTERSYINAWLDMGFEDEALALAYDRTVTNTGALKWGYMNKILLSWHEKGLHSREEILEKDGRGRKRAPAPSASGSSVDIRQLDELINQI